MAGKKKGAVNKSAFIRGVLEKNSAASAKDAQDAWKSAGHKGKLSPALFYQTKARMGLGSRRQKRRGRPAKAAASAALASTDSYLAIEQQLDKLIAQSVELKDGNLSDALLTARRRASAKLL